MTDKKYTADDIQVLTDQEHVRTRLSVYAGNVHLCEYEVPVFDQNTITLKNIKFVPAVYKCVGEIIDNSIDEFAQIKKRNKKLTIKANPEKGEYTISDTGRGVPIEKHEIGKYTPEVVFSMLRSGRNFGNDKDAGVIGMNGMGSAITNFCSSAFTVDITQNKKKYHQEFANGGVDISKPSIKKTTSTQTGTEISFKLDEDVFDDVAIPEEIMRNRAIEVALTNPGVTTEYNGENFLFKKGFEEFIKHISNEYFKFTTDGIEFFVVFDFYEGIDEKIFSWVNSSFLFDGGICNTQFLNAFVDKVVSHLSAQAKKNKCEVTKNDVRRNLMVFGNMKISDPEYDAQSKTRLTGPNLKKVFVSMIDEHWNMFSRKNKDWFNQVIERAMVRHHSQANKKAVKDHKKNLSRKIPGLVDATNKNRMDCQLLVTEGDSAAGMITDARDPKTTAALPLRGKINNVHGTTVAQLLNMGKVTDLLAAIGLIPGQKAMRSDLNYGRVVIATDADNDGADIFTLLVNVFFQFWPELFDPDYPPFIYRLVAPNVVAAKGNKRVHFPTREHYEKQKHKYKNWEIIYMKGLGSMVNKDWEMILSGESDTFLPIVDDGNMVYTLELLFGPNADLRKKWLQLEE